MSAFFIMGSWILLGSGAVMSLFFHFSNTEAIMGAMDKHPFLAFCFKIWVALCCYGMPILALILGILGRLPGTRRRKDLVQT